jgi:diacylglycerol kinase (ATP)
VREESAFRQELTLAAILVPLNSSVEAAVDRISFEHHGLSKRAKDYESAAVMLALLVCTLKWITLGWRLLTET